MRSRAKITNGRWERQIPAQWKMAGGVWRTDIFKSVLADDRLKEAAFICKDGPVMVVPVDDLRRVLPCGSDHYGAQIWGPFSLDPGAKTIEGYSVAMTLE
jgi:hypothetical protein